MKYQYEIVESYSCADAIDELNKLGERGYKVYHVESLGLTADGGVGMDIFYLMKEVSHED